MISLRDSQDKFIKVLGLSKIVFSQAMSQVDISHLNFVSFLKEEKSFFEAKKSKNKNQTLCFVYWYSIPGFPSQTIIFILRFLNIIHHIFFKIFSK